jgi:hypothetical protein
MAMKNTKAGKEKASDHKKAVSKNNSSTPKKGSASGKTSTVKKAIAKKGTPVKKKATSIMKPPVKGKKVLKQTVKKVAISKKAVSKGHIIEKKDKALKKVVVKKELKKPMLTPKASLKKQPVAGNKSVAAAKPASKPKAPAQKKVISKQAPGILKNAPTDQTPKTTSVPVDNNQVQKKQFEVPGKVIETDKRSQISIPIEKTETERFAVFHKRYGRPASYRRVTQDIIERYGMRVPKELVEEWQENGLCSYEDGFLWFVSPDEYAAVLHEWLADADNFIVFGRTAFGKLFLWHQTKGVYILDIHNGDLSFMTTEFELFVDGSLSRDQFLDDGLQRPRFREARSKLGPLSPDEMYAFEPPVALGGPGTVDSLIKVKIIERLSSLAHLRRKPEF